MPWETTGCFAGERWKPKPFTIDNYLNQADLENATADQRKSFWQLASRELEAIEAPDTAQAGNAPGVAEHFRMSAQVR